MLEKFHRLEYQALANHGLAAHEQHRLDAVLVAQHTQLMEHGRVVHLVAREVRIAGTVNEAVAAFEVADVGHIDQRPTKLAPAEVRRLAECAVMLGRHNSKLTTAFAERANSPPASAITIGGPAGRLAKT